MANPTQTLPEGPQAEYTESQLEEMQAIPSRQFISDGTKNPFYDARMDPGSDRWDAHAYFKRRPQADVFVHIDPEAPELEVFGMSINGFELPCYPGHRQRMPIDFVELLRGRNQRLDVHEIGLVSRKGDEDREGALTLAVGRSQARPFVRKITD